MKFGEDLNVIEFLEETLKSSDFIKTVQRINNGLFSEKELRKLTAEEIKSLEDQNNFCRNWQNIKVTKNFSTENIIRSTFLGKMVIGDLTGQVTINDFEHKSGIINSILYDVQIGNGCVIENVQTLSSVAMEAGSALLNCLSVTHGNTKNFGGGKVVTLEEIME